MWYDEGKMEWWAMCLPAYTHTLATAQRNRIKHWRNIVFILLSERSLIDDSMPIVWLWPMSALAAQDRWSSFSVLCKMREQKSDDKERTIGAERRMWAIANRIDSLFDRHTFLADRQSLSRHAVRIALWHLLNRPLTKTDRSAWVIEQPFNGHTFLWKRCTTFTCSRFDF